MARQEKGTEKIACTSSQARSGSGEARNCDLMLMPSELESFGLAALEAMACKVPTISTNVGGVPELIDHGKNGFLTNVGDVEMMAKYAVEILSDEKRLREMGDLARLKRNRASVQRRSLSNTRSLRSGPRALAVNFVRS